MFETFKAGTHYGDWEGTAAADGHDLLSVHKYLRENDLMSDEEFLIATSVYVIEGSAFIRAYTFRGGPAMESVREEIAKDSDPVSVHEIRLEMTLDEYIKLFKQFNVVLTWRGLNLQGLAFNTV